VTYSFRSLLGPELDVERPRAGVQHHLPFGGRFQHIHRRHRCDDLVQRHMRLYMPETKTRIQKRKIQIQPKHPTSWKAKHETGERQRTAARARKTKPGRRDDDSVWNRLPDWKILGLEQQVLWMKETIIRCF
jgi:hypothetical protein